MADHSAIEVRWKESPHGPKRELRVAINRPAGLSEPSTVDERIRYDDEPVPSEKSILVAVVDVEADDGYAFEP